MFNGSLSGRLEREMQAKAETTLPAICKKKKASLLVVSGEKA
jgi:hypothetical protein